MVWFALELLSHQARSISLKWVAYASQSYATNEALKNILKKKRQALRQIIDLASESNTNHYISPMGSSLLPEKGSIFSLWALSIVFEPFPLITPSSLALSQDLQSLFSPSRSVEVQSHSSVGVKVNNWLTLLCCSCGSPDERSRREIFSALFFDPWTWQALGRKADVWSELLHLNRVKSLFSFVSSYHHCPFTPLSVHTIDY